MVRRKQVFFILRIVASAVMLALLLSRIHLSSLLPEDHAHAAAWLAAGLVTWLVAIVLATMRWQRVLAALELPADLPPLLSYSLAGLFVANFLPTTIGGDGEKARRSTVKVAMVAGTSAIRSAFILSTA